MAHLDKQEFKGIRSVRPPEGGPGAAIGALLVFVGVWMFAWVRLSPPPVRSGPFDVSIARALDHVRALAAQPRAPASENHARVRAEIERRLAELGAEVEVQTTLGWADDPVSRTFSAGTVENVLGRIRGKGAPGSILLIAHYDTVAQSPGAADDGAGVATLLEIARLLHAGPPPQRDVLFLFTDGEEEGLLGINAFLREHPASSTVAVSVNLEARGSQGASLLFETGHPNREWIDLWATSVPDPVGNSVASEIYRHLPNDTDFTAVAQRKVPGFNFAFIEGLGRYHTAADRIEALEPRSLAHQGNAALALARALSSQPALPKPRGGDAVFFDVCRLWVVRYSERTALALALAAVALCLIATGTALARRRASMARIGLALAAQLTITTALLGGLLGLWWLAAWAEPEVAARLHSWPEAWRSILLLLCVSSAAWVAGADSFAARWLRQAERSLSVLALFSLAALVTSVWALGASYVFAWPALLWGAHAVAEGGRAPSSAVTFLAAVAAAATGLVAAPVVLGLGLALPVPTAVLSCTLAAFACAPIAVLLSRAGKRSFIVRSASLAAGSALALQAMLLMSTRIDELHPHPDNLLYVADSTAHRAIWVSADEAPSPFSSALFHSGAAAALYPLPMSTRLRSTAPYVELAPPQALTVHSGGDGREVRLGLSLSPLYRAVWIDLGEEYPMTLVTLQGKAIPPSDNRRWIRYRGDAYVDLLLSRSASGRPLDVRLVGESLGLPSAALLGRARPGEYPAGPDLLSDVSLSSFRLRR